MMSEDQILMWCNETELLGIAFRQGLGRLRRGMRKEELVAIVSGEVPVRPEHLSETTETRRRLQNFINKNWGQLRSQLPGCNGQCSSYPCTEGKHCLCLYPNKNYDQ